MTTVLSKYEKFSLDNTKRFYIQDNWIPSTTEYHISPSTIHRMPTAVMMKHRQKMHDRFSIVDYQLTLLNVKKTMLDTLDNR